MKLPKIFFILLGITALVVTGIGLYYVKNLSGKAKSDTSLSVSAPSPTASADLATWVDQSEFQFDYPKSVRLDPHDEDTNNYAHIELTSPQHEGKILVWVKDAPLQTLEKYMASAKVDNLLDTTLGGHEAKKGIVHGQKTMVIALLRNGFLYQIDADLSDRQYWEGILNQMIYSFRFVEPTDAPDSKEEQINQPPAEESGADEELIE